MCPRYTRSGERFFVRDDDVEVYHREPVITEEMVKAIIDERYAEHMSAFTKALGDQRRS